MKIENIAEAREAAEALADFWTRFNQAFGTVGTLTGLNNNHAPKANKSVAPQTAVREMVEDKPKVRAPATMPERIVAILGQSKRGLTPKEMTLAYEGLGWPIPSGRKLYSVLLSSAYYLAKRQKKLINDHGRYSLPAEQTAEQEI